MSDYTAEDARTANKLMSRADFLRRREGLLTRPTVVLDDPNRQSGRTTEMLLDAAAAALNGSPVIIVGATPRYAKTLVRDAGALAAVTDHERPVSFLPWSYRQRRRRGNSATVVIFHDHHVGR